MKALTPPPLCFGNRKHMQHKAPGRICSSTFLQDSLAWEAATGALGAWWPTPTACWQLYRQHWGIAGTGQGWYPGTGSPSGALLTDPLIGETKGSIYLPATAGQVYPSQASEVTWLLRMTRAQSRSTRKASRAEKLRHTVKEHLALWPGSTASTCTPVMQHTLTAGPLRMGDDNHHSG